jgi:hypothetical protein
MTRLSAYEHNAKVVKCWSVLIMHATHHVNTRAAKALIRCLKAAPAGASLVLLVCMCHPVVSPYCRCVGPPHLFKACALCNQALKEGTLDTQVFSLQARRAQLESLDLIPAELTYGTASAATNAASQGGDDVPARPILQACGSKRHPLPPMQQVSLCVTQTKRHKGAGLAHSSLNSSARCDADADDGCDRRRSSSARVNARLQTMAGGCDELAVGGSTTSIMPPSSASPAAKQQQPTVTGLEGDASLGTFKGATLGRRRNVHEFHIAVLGKRIHLGTYKPHDAAAGARTYDALQLLLHGSCANTNFQ